MEKNNDMIDLNEMRKICNFIKEFAGDEALDNFIARFWKERSFKTEDILKIIVEMQPQFDMEKINSVY